MRSWTTLRLTSASSRATRISLRASAMFSSVSVPWPRRFLKTRCNLSVRFSNMVRFQCTGRCAYFAGPQTRSPIRSPLFSSPGMFAANNFTTVPRQHSKNRFSIGAPGNSTPRSRVCAARPSCHAFGAGGYFEADSDLLYFLLLLLAAAMGFELHAARRHRVSHVGKAAAFLQDLLRRRQGQERRRQRAGHAGASLPHHQPCGAGAAAGRARGDCRRRLSRVYPAGARRHRPRRDDQLRGRARGKGRGEGRGAW